MTNWVNIFSLKVGQYIHFDGGSDCMKAGPKEVKRDEQQGLYVDCGEGRHYLYADAKDSQYVVGFRVNPLITAMSRVEEIDQHLNDPLTEGNEKYKSEADPVFNTALMSADKRLALVAIRAASFREKHYNSKEGRYEYDTIYCVAQFTPDAFEATLISLALNGWWNDVLDAACKTLGIVEGENYDEQLAEKYPL